MKLIKPSHVPKNRSTHPIFTGGEVTRQPLTTKEMGDYFNIMIVHFGQGARTKFHKHTSDQVLMVNSGNGIVKTEQEELLVGPGDVVHIAAGETHWHGATQDSDFSHISIVSVDDKLTILEN
jgi:quercetin dioxygenase-like cupin family protein